MRRGIGLVAVATLAGVAALAGACTKAQPANQGPTGHNVNAPILGGMAYDPLPYAGHPQMTPGSHLSFVIAMPTDRAFGVHYKGTPKDVGNPGPSTTTCISGITISGKFQPKDLGPSVGVANEGLVMFPPLSTLNSLAFNPAGPPNNADPTHLQVDVTIGPKACSFVSVQAVTQQIEPASGATLEVALDETNFQRFAVGTHGLKAGQVDLQWQNTDIGCQGSARLYNVANRAKFLAISGGNPVYTGSQANHVANYKGHVTVSPDGTALSLLLVTPASCLNEHRVLRVYGTLSADQ